MCELFGEVGKNGIRRCEKGLSIYNSFSQATFSVAQGWPLFLDDKCVGNEGEEQHRGSQLASAGFSLMESSVGEQASPSNLSSQNYVAAQRDYQFFLVEPKAVGLSLWSHCFSARLTKFSSIMSY